MSQAPPVPSGSPIIEAAWAGYQRELQRARDRVQAVWYYNHDPRVRSQAEFNLQQLVGTAYTMAIMPRADFPVFYTDTFLAPNTFTHSGPNPDTTYRITFLNGQRTYRLHGKRNTSPFCHLQVNSEYWVPESRMIGSYMLDDFKIEADGSFEIIVSADRPQANWIALDHDCGNNALMIRVGAGDWEAETPAEFHIEALDHGVGIVPSLDLSEVELARRITQAGRMIRYVTDEFTIALPRLYWEKAGRQANVFGYFSGAEQTQCGAPTFATYGSAFFELAAGEALILTTDVPAGILWHFLVRDPWLQATDYVFHQSSLNRHQARIDADGKFRAVLSPVDPGVPNWLDTMGMNFGMLQYRWYLAKNAPSFSAAHRAIAQPLAGHLKALQILNPQKVTGEGHRMIQISSAALARELAHTGANYRVDGGQCRSINLL